MAGSTPHGCDPHPTRFRWSVLLLIFLAYTLASADRANIGIVLPDVQKHFRLSNSEMGSIVGLFFIAYAICQIPSAFLIKRFGVRRIMPLGLLFTSLMTAAHGLVGSAMLLRFARIGLGIAEAPVPNACVATINAWFPAREKGTAAGIFMASTKLGPVVVPPLGALIIVTMGWHWVFILFAIPGFLLPLFWLWLVPDDPADSSRVNAAEATLIRDRSLGSAKERALTARGTARFDMLDRISRTRKVKLIDTSRGVFTSWNVWGVALSYFVLAGTMNVILAWLPKYLTEVKGFSIMKVGFIAATPFAGAVLGNLFGGWLSDNVLGNRRKPLMMVSCLSLIVMMYVLKAAPQSIPLVALLFFMAGFLLSIGFSLYVVFPAGLTQPQVFPIAGSLVNTCGQIGGAILPFVTGMMLDAGGWDQVFLVLSVAGAIGFLLLLSIVEPRGTLPDPSKAVRA